MTCEILWATRNFKFFFVMHSLAG